MLAGRVILADHVTLGTGTVMWGLDFNYFVIIFGVLYLEDPVPRGGCQVLICESTGLVSTEGV